MTHTVRPDELRLNERDIEAPLPRRPLGVSWYEGGYKKVWAQALVRLVVGSAASVIPVAIPRGTIKLRPSLSESLAVCLTNIDEVRVKWLSSAPWCSSGKVREQIHALVLYAWKGESILPQHPGSELLGESLHSVSEAPNYQVQRPGDALQHAGAPALVCALGPAARGRALYGWPARCNA